MSTDQEEDSHPSWAFTCSSCGFDVWKPLGRLSVSIVGFYDDDRFPGRCLLVYSKQHVDHLTELSNRDAAAFVADAQALARAVVHATGAHRMNYAILGNTEPHLHMHVIPRYAAGDPIPDRPPWEHPHQKRPMEPKAAAALAEKIRQAIHALAPEGG